MKNLYNKKRKKPDHKEHRTMVSVFKWAKMYEGKYPQLTLLNGSMNGVNLEIQEAKRAKDAGMKKGFPDINLPVARGGFIGLYIELKEKNNKPRPEQISILRALGREGHLPLMIRGFENTVNIIENYLLGKIKRRTIPVIENEINGCEQSPETKHG